MSLDDYDRETAQRVVSDAFGFDPDAMSDDGVERDPVELLAAEFVEEYRLGRTPTIEEYAARYPDLAEPIQALFPAVAALEGLRLHKEQRLAEKAEPAAALERLGDFRLVREIGRGGMGVVYEAVQESLGRRVAVKVLPAWLVSDPRQVARFRREAQTAAQLHHTNIVPVYGVGEQAEVQFYVMQRIDGVGLDRLIAPQPSERTEMQLHEATDPGLMPDAERVAAPVELSWRLPSAAMARARWVARVGVQVAQALHYAHEQGTLHRDIKPSNLLLDRNGTVLVTDFGLAVVDASDQPDLEAALASNYAAQGRSGSSLTATTAGVCGTLRYMAPEQFRGHHDERSDIYALGVTLYELATGQAAFSARSREALVERVRRGGLLPVRLLDPGMPRDFEAIIAKATTPHPDGRYSSAAEFAADCERFLADQPVSARPVSAAVRLWRWRRRNPALAALLACVAVLIVTIGVLTAVHSRSVRAALARETQQRRKADAASQLASEALDNIFARFSRRDTDQSVDEAPVTRDVALLLQDLLKYYDRLTEHGGDSPEMQRKSGEARRRVGDIQQRLGQYDAAIAAYGQAIERYQAVAGSRDVRADLARVYNERGRAHFVLNRAPEAQAAYREALTLLTRLYEDDPQNLALEYSLARTYFLLARWARPGESPSVMPPEDRPRPDGPRPDGPPDAPRRPEEPPDGPRRADRKQLELAIALLERRVPSAEAGPPAHRQLLAACWREWAGDDVNRRSAAETEAEERANALLEALVAEFPDVPDYRHDLLKSQSQYAVIGPAMHDETVLRFVSQQLRKAVEHGRTLLDSRPDVPEYTLSVVHVHARSAIVEQSLARLSSDRTQADEHWYDAETHLRRAVNLQTLLVKQFPESQGHRIWLAKFQTALGVVLRQGRQFDESHVHLARAVSNLLKGQPEGEEPSDNVRVVLADAYFQLSATLHAKGEREQARSAQEEAQRLEGRDTERGPPRRFSPPRPQRPPPRAE